MYLNKIVCRLDVASMFTCGNTPSECPIDEPRRIVVLVANLNLDFESRFWGKIHYFASWSPKASEIEIVSFMNQNTSESILHISAVYGCVLGSNKEIIISKGRQLSMRKDTGNSNFQTFILVRNWYLFVRRERRRIIFSIWKTSNYNYYHLNFYNFYIELPGIRKENQQ